MVAMEVMIEEIMAAAAAPPQAEEMVPIIMVTMERGVIAITVPAVTLRQLLLEVLADEEPPIETITRIMLILVLIMAAAVVAESDQMVFWEWEVGIGIPALAPPVVS